MDTQMIAELEKIPCMIDKSHKQHVKSFKESTAIIECIDCKNCLGITTQLKVSVKPKK